MTSFQALTVSLIVHFFLYLGLKFFFRPAENSNYVPIEISFNKPNSSQKKQLIDEPNSPPQDPLKELRDKATHLSKTTRRFLEQTKARNIGETKNLMPGSILPDLAKRKNTQIDASGEGEPLDTRFLPRGGRSTTDDLLPDDIQLGDMTALNADAHLYYSFFERIKSKLRYHWIQRIRNSIYELTRSEVPDMTRNIWNTQIEVVIDKNGHVVKSTLTRSSGIRRFDQAALQAFRAGSPYPNPPEEMKEADGFIYLDYAFQVYWHPGPIKR